MNLTKTTLAGIAAAAMLLPMAASAHEGFNLGVSMDGKDNNPGLHLGAFLGVRAGDDHASTTAKVEDRHDDRGEHQKFGTSTVAFKGDATTTVARITAKANRISTTADLMAALSGTLSSKIAAAGLSASSTASANAKLSDYNTSLTNAKAQAAAAVTAAGNITATDASSTNATFVVQAQADLKAARDMIRAAGQDLHFILSLIFKA